MQTFFIAVFAISLIEIGSLLGADKFVREFSPAVSAEPGAKI
jgi:hypothetical protein